MRFLPPFIALMIALPASAHQDAKSPNHPAAESSNRDEKTQVLTATSTLRDNDASVHGRETAAKIYRTDGKHLLLEMRGLVLQKLIHGSVAIEEREVGETRRLFV